MSRHSPANDLATRKRLLHAESALLRLSLSQQLTQAWAPVHAVAERTRAGGRWMSMHPLASAAVAAALLVWRPSQVLRMARRGLTLWQLWQGARPAAQALLDRLSQATSQTGDAAAMPTDQNALNTKASKR
jgi:hypothetical protein